MRSRRIRVRRRSGWRAAVCPTTTYSRHHPLQSHPRRDVLRGVKSFSCDCCRPRPCCSCAWQSSWSGCVSYTSRASSECSQSQVYAAQPHLLSAAQRGECDACLRRPDQSCWRQHVLRSMIRYIAWLLTASLTGGVPIGRGGCGPVRVRSAGAADRRAEVSVHLSCPPLWDISNLSNKE